MSNMQLAASAEVNKRHLLEIANQLATGNTMFAANAAIELGQLAAKDGGIDIIVSAPAAEVAIKHLCKRLKAASLPGALRDEVQAATACAGAVHLISVDPRGAAWLMDPTGEGLLPLKPFEDAVPVQLMDGLASLLRFDPAAVAEAVCAFAGLLAHPSASHRLEQVGEPVFRTILSGLVTCIYTQPVRVKELAVEAILLLVDCPKIRKRIFLLAGWERLMLGELLDLSRTDSRRYAMALIVTFLGYEDFRHQLVTKLDSLQPLLAELTVFVQTGNDALAMACAALCALASDDVSRRQLLHMPHTTPLISSLVNSVRPTAASPFAPACYAAPVMSTLLAFSQDLFSQVRLLSVHPEPEAMPEVVIGALLSPPWWWAPMWVDNPEVKDAARADAAALLLHLLGTENNCRVLRQRHHQMTVLPKWYTKLVVDLQLLAQSHSSNTSQAAWQSLCAMLAAGGVAWLGQDQALVVSLVESLVKHMDMTEDADSSNHGAMAAEALFMMAGGKEARRDQEAACQAMVEMLPMANVDKLLRALCHLMHLPGQTAIAPVSAGRVLRLFLGGGRGMGESLLTRLVKAGNPTHPVSWLSPVGSILGIGPSLCYHPGGLFDVVLVTLAAALGSNLLERQAPAAVVLRSFAGVKEAWERVLRQNKMVSRRMLGGVVAVLCAKDLATERVAAAAVVFMLSEEGMGQEILDDQEGRDIYFLLEALLGMLRSGDPIAVQMASGTLDNLRYRSPPAWARRMDSLQYPTNFSMNKNNMIAEMDAARIEST